MRLGLAIERGSRCAVDDSYARQRDELLRASLPPALLAAAAVSFLQAAVDLTRYRGSFELRSALYLLTLFISLGAAALSRMPSLRHAPRQIAIAFDLAYTLTLVSFFADPGTTVSGIALNLCLKVLATAVLFPWPPPVQYASGALSVVAYWVAIAFFHRSVDHTHHLTAPFLAAVLASAGATYADRARRALSQKAADLQASETRLRDALEAERHLVSIARQTSLLEDLPGVLGRLGKVVVDGLGCDFSTILLTDESNPDLLRVVSYYRSDGAAAPVEESDDLAIRDWEATDLKHALDDGDAVVLNDVDEQHVVARKLLRKYKVRRIAIARIGGPDKTLGVVMAGALSDGPDFDERRVFLLRGIAAHAAIAIRNARLFQQLAVSENAYRDLFERANDLIFIAEDNGRIDFANKAALDFFAIPPEALADTRWPELIDEPERPRMQRRLQLAQRRLAASRHDVSDSGGFEVDVRTPGGGTAALEIRTCRITSPGVLPRRYHCVARDITERRRRQQETQALLERLQESNRLQDEFVANMSHELRTPLNVIIGYADLIADEKSLALNSDARSFLDRINAAARALHRMVESILEYARLDRGRMVLIPTHFSSDHLLLELLGLCNDVRSSFEVDLAIHQEEAIDFVTDYDRLYSVLTNLLLNALKFTPRGRVLLHLRRRGDQAEFLIRDTGIGIHPAELRHVFEPFRQADGSDTRTFGGVGLGLAIVRRNVDLLHGSIDVESEIDIGTTFTLRVPIHLAGAPPQRAESRGAA
jgi:PAS domain S-box-containing protein